jgi:hypothetical protein
MALMQSPDAANNPNNKVPAAPIVLFEWGVFKFRGLIKMYKETIDFFSATGVPLRSTISLQLAEQKKKPGDPPDQKSDKPPPPDTYDVLKGAGTFAASVAAQGGNPGAARAIAALNGQASLRFGAGASLSVTGSVTLGPPVAFASAGVGIAAGAGFGVGAGASAGIGIGASAGIGANAGLGPGAGLGASAGIGASFGASAGTSVTAGIGASTGVGASAGFAAGAGIGAGAGIQVGGGAGINAIAAAAPMAAGARFGASASAGVSASEGAFAGLRTSTRTVNYSIETDRFLQLSQSQAVSIAEGASFYLGGQAAAAATPGLSADVGAKADLLARIQFEVD